MELEIPEDARTWPASIFSVVTGALLLPFGRLVDMYGGYIIYNIGLLWFIIWSLIAGFSTNYIMLIFCRALQAIGSAAFLPAGIMLMGSTYRPGPRKNLIFALYGAFAPLGFFFGILFGGITGQFLTWRWYFWIGCIAGFVASAVSFVVIPKGGADKKVRMDWWGATTIVPGLLLVVFSLTGGSHAPNGFATHYILVTLIVGILLIAMFIYTQARVASAPLLPFDLFSTPSMKPLVVALFFSYGVFGVFLFYSSF
jgi:MFS family permease